MVHAPLIFFMFIAGACVGSFLNVIVWRLPRGESLTYPPSHCPKCNKLLPLYDNIPILGWLKLGGKCRFCHEPISARYPIIESICGFIFALYYFMFFVLQIGPCASRVAVELNIFRDWPMYLLYMVMIAGLLAASLIDAEMFIIPIEIPWVIGGLGIIAHTIIDRPSLPGALNLAPEPAALAAGGGVGLLLSLALWARGIIPVSFPDGEPMQDLDPVEDEPPPKEWSRRDLIVEMRKEMMFLLPPMLMAAGWWFLTVRVPGVQRWWEGLMQYYWLTGLLGAVFGALVGAFVVWVTRILGTLGFGRLAMGLGDVHLMFGVGAIIGAGAATVSFFLAPFFGIALAIYMLATGKKREIPYGPYLSLAAAFVVFFYCPIAAWLQPGMEGIGVMIRGTLHIGTDMQSLWLKIKVWTKISLTGIIGIYILIFVLKNGGRQAKFWYWFNHDYETSLLALVFFAFLIGGLVAILTIWMTRTVGQVRELRARSRSKRLEAEVADMKVKAAMLQTKPGGTTTTISAHGSVIPSPPPPREP